MNPVLQEILKTGKCGSPNGKTYTIDAAISPKEGKMLQEIIRQLKPVKTLEVGLAFGLSALYICDALLKTPETRHFVIDPHQEGPNDNSWGGTGLYNLKKAGFGDMLKFYQMPSYEALPKILDEGHKFDFAFIDGWHTFDFTLVDFFYIDKMLKVGGVVAFDDADWPAVRKVCRFIAANLSYSVIATVEPLPARVTVKRRLLQFVRKCFPKISERLLNVEIMRSDAELGLIGTCVAFRKDSEDFRDGIVHRDF